MKIFNYQKTCQELLEDLPEREKEVISRRFGLNGGEKETLGAIGQNLGITRERVRQIEKAGLLRIKPKIKNYQKVFQFFSQYLKRYGGLRKEEILLSDLGGKKYQAQVYFLLTISDNFKRFGENEDFHSFWALDSYSLNSVKKTIETLFKKLKGIGKPLSLKETGVPAPYLEISKKILRNSDGLYGLKDWPEINPRGVKDKAYLVFKRFGKPLHFKEVAKQIKGALVQTVHNELIKDPRFVLVGRGIYALREWGYIPGQVKDIIAKILKEEGPLTQKEILERVLKQRLVKKSTILLNLSNEKNFLKNSQGKYIIREV